MAGGDSLRRQATLAGIPIKHLTLVALVIQNAALTLLMRYSRVMPLVNGDRYYASTAVFLSEAVKLSFFLSMALYETATNPQTPEPPSTVSELSSSLSRAVFTRDGWRLAILAILFALQNTLQYTAAGNLDAVTFAVTANVKVISAAVFGLILLGKMINVRRWFSLVLMAFGIIVVQMSCVSRQDGRILSIKDLRDGVSFNTPRSIWKRSATYEGIVEDVLAANPKMNASIGLAAAVVACFISGIACVFFERTLKAKAETKASIWIRNVQLAFYSLGPAGVGVLFMDGEHISKAGFLTGYNWVVWAVILLQAVGGVLTALAINYSDSVTKSLMSSISAIVTFMISVLFLEFQTTTLYLLGIAATAFAAFYFDSARDGKRPPAIRIERSEPSYFDLEKSNATEGRSPLRDTLREGLSSSRPGTPVSERRHLRSKSTKRDL